MCGNPRAHVLRAFHWLTSRRRRLPLADPASQWLLYSPLIGRRPGHSRSCPLMCRSCVWCRGRGCSTTASGCKHTHACTHHGAGPRDAQYVLCIIWSTQCFMAPPPQTHSQNTKARAHWTRQKRETLRNPAHLIMLLCDLLNKSDGQTLQLGLYRHKHFYFSDSKDWGLTTQIWAQRWQKCCPPPIQL